MKTLKIYSLNIQQCSLYYSCCTLLPYLTAVSVCLLACCSIAQSCRTVGNPMVCSTPGFPFGYLCVFPPPPPPLETSDLMFVLKCN